MKLEGSAKLLSRNLKVCMKINGRLLNVAEKLFFKELLVKKKRRNSEEIEKKLKKREKTKLKLTLVKTYLFLLRCSSGNI